MGMNASNDSMSSIGNLAKLIGQASLGGGIVGKTSRAILALFGILAVVLFRLSGNPLLDVPLLVVAGVATAVFVWWICRTHEFAAKNPKSALRD
jgi:hypothetical protein